MKSKKLLKILAALAVGTLMAGTIAIAACGDSGNSGDSGNGDPVTHTHVWSTTGTDNGNGTHKLTCSGEGECDLNKEKNENHNTSGTDGACSVCGHKEEQKAPEAQAKNWTVTVVGEAPNIVGNNGSAASDLTVACTQYDKDKDFKLNSQNKVNDTLTITMKGLAKGQTVTLVMEAWTGSGNSTNGYNESKLKLTSNTNASLNSGSSDTVSLPGGGTSAQHVNVTYALTVSADGDVTLVFEKADGTAKIGKIEIDVK